MGDASLFPVLSIVDAELMKSVPATFTAYQGFDALFHSTEGYIAKGANLMSDMYALEAIRNIAEYLPRAIKDGNDLDATLPNTCPVPSRTAMTWRPVPVWLSAIRCPAA